jgi:hypothetical protein
VNVSEISDEDHDCEREQSEPDHPTAARLAEQRAKTSEHRHQGKRAKPRQVRLRPLPLQTHEQPQAQRYAEPFEYRNDVHRVAQKLSPATKSRDAISRRAKKFKGSKRKGSNKRQLPRSAGLRPGANRAKNCDGSRREDLAKIFLHSSPSPPSRPSRDIPKNPAVFFVPRRNEGKPKEQPGGKKSRAAPKDFHPSPRAHPPRHLSLPLSFEL